MRGRKMEENAGGGGVLGENGREMREKGDEIPSSPIFRRPQTFPLVPLEAGCPVSGCEDGENRSGFPKTRASRRRDVRTAFGAIQFHPGSFSAHFGIVSCGVTPPALVTHTYIPLIQVGVGDGQNSVSLSQARGAHVEICVRIRIIPDLPRREKSKRGGGSAQVEGAAGTGVGGRPRGSRSTCKQRDKPPTLMYPPL